MLSGDGLYAERNVRGVIPGTPGGGDDGLGAVRSVCGTAGQRPSWIESPEEVEGLATPIVGWDANLCWAGGDLAGWNRASDDSTVRLGRSVPGRSGTVGSQFEVADVAQPGEPCEDRIRDDCRFRSGRINRRSLPNIYLGGGRFCSKFGKGTLT